MQLWNRFMHVCFLICTIRAWMFLYHNIYFYKFFFSFIYIYLLLFYTAERKFLKFIRKIKSLSLSSQIRLNKLYFIAYLLLCSFLLSSRMREIRWLINKYWYRKKINVMIIIIYKIFVSYGIFLLFYCIVTYSSVRVFF